MTEQEPIRFRETDEDRFWEMLGVLPPEIQERGGFLVGEPWDHCPRTGRERFMCHWEVDGKFYESTRPITVKEFKSIDPSAITAE